MLLGKDSLTQARGVRPLGHQPVDVALAFGIYPAIPILSIHRRTVFIQKLKGTIALSTYPLSHIRALCGSRRQG
ncbi:MAG: hypothetical protein QHH07_06530 [Sedimentisphaerales bacterium]|jgi:hypothetical protein|nr:hypothetical protein [Sedimentisphaerales bacterium]